jgi:hypothetical protein
MNAKKPTVSVQVQTDSAKRPMWDQPLKRKIAGITLRDLRFAILVETLYSERYGQDQDDKRLIRPLEHRPHWRKLLRILRKNSLERAPSPSSSAPPTPSPEAAAHNTGSSPIPRSSHSASPSSSPSLGDSKLESASQPKNKTKSKASRNVPLVCTKCGMNHPTEICPLNEPFAPCPNCGGHHWLVDCREPQADPESAMELALPLPTNKFRL